MTPENVTAWAAASTTILAFSIVVVSIGNWCYRRQEERRKLELCRDDWEMLHILTRDDTGLLSFSIQADSDNNENEPDKLELPGTVVEELRELVAKGILYEDPGASRSKASFRFTRKGRKVVRDNKEKLANWYE